MSQGSLPEKGKIMRPVSEGDVAEERDLMHLTRIFKRARKNLRRTPEMRKKVTHHLTELITIFTSEQTARAESSEEAPAPKRTKRTGVAA